MIKILILGGHGFVGKNLINALKHTNYKIFPLSRKDGLDLTNIDITRPWLKKINPDIIINVAAHVGSVHYVTKYAADIIHDNIQMTLNIYQSVKEICPNARIINPLSNCSYPGTSDIQRESEWLSGRVHESVFSYGNYKRFLYIISKCYNMQYNIDSINLLLPNTFGPGDSINPNKTHALNGMIIRMIRAKRSEDKVFEIWGTGKPIREWLFIKDAINILIKSIKFKKSIIYPINVGQNKGYTIKESAQLIAQAIGFKGKLIFNIQYQDGAPIKIMDDKHFKKLFPNYKFYNHKKGIQETVNYYQSIL